MQLPDIVSDSQLEPLSIGPILQEPKWLPGGRAIRPTASLNDSALLRIDLNGQHVVDLLTPMEPE